MNKFIAFSILLFISANVHAWYGETKWVVSNGTSCELACQNNSPYLYAVSAGESSTYGDNFICRGQFIIPGETRAGVNFEATEKKHICYLPHNTTVATSIYDCLCSDVYNAN